MSSLLAVTTKSAWIANFEDKYASVSETLYRSDELMAHV